MGCYIASVDIGSTSIKAFIFELNGKIAASAKRPIKLCKDAEGIYYNDEDIWQGVTQALSDSVSQVQANEISALAVTGFGNDGILVDKQGRGLYPFISWQCNRTILDYEQFISQFSREQIYMNTGVQPRHVDSLYKFLWLKRKKPEILEAAYKWLMIEDYVNYRLCGEMVSDYTVSFTTSLYDPQTARWSERMIKASGLNGELFVPVLPSGTIIGRITSQAAEETGLMTGLPLVLGGWDIACSSLAVGAYKDNTIMDVMGTWETVSFSSLDYIRNQKMFEIGFNACHHVATGRYSYPMYFVSSAMIEWFMDACYKSQSEHGLTSSELYEQFICDALSAGIGAGGTLFMPDHYGSVLPISDSRSRGAFIGLTNNTRKSHLARAVLEGLSYLFKDIVDACEQIRKIPIDKLIICGGGARNRAWRQIKADISGKHMVMPAVDETTALGAAIKAGVGIGMYKDDDEAVFNMLSLGIEVTPSSANTRLYDPYFKAYQQLYGLLRDVNHTLSRLSTI